MRGSGWIWALLPFALWCAAVGGPAVIAVSIVLGDALRATGDSELAAHGMRHAGRLWGEGVLWGAAIGVTAALIGWMPGRLLRSLAAASIRRFIAVGGLILVPAILPAYLGSWCWWQLAPPDSAMGEWIIRSGHGWWMRHTMLTLGLLGWAWPVAAWTVAGLGVGAGRAVGDAARLDGATRRARIRLAWHEDRTALLLAATVTGLFVFGNTTAFDIALVRSFGFELRTLQVRGATAGQTVWAAMPTVVTALLAIGVAWSMLSRRRGGADPDRRTSLAAPVVTTSLIAIGVLVPMILLVRAVPVFDRGAEFFSLYGRAMLGSLVVALGTGLSAAIVAVGSAALASDRRRWVRAIAESMLVGWAVAAAVPATVVATAIVSLYNRGEFARAIYDSPLIVLIGHLACFGLVGALLGRQAAAATPPALRDQAALDGAGTFLGTVVTLRPLLLAAAAASMVIAMSMSMGEVVIAGLLQPPGFDSLAAALLNAVHYQRPETVMIGTLILLLLATAAAVVVPMAWSITRRVGRHPAGVALLASAVIGGVAMPGCAPVDAASPPPIPTRLMFGRPGVGGGQFDYPRAIAVDGARERVYVIDKTARIQRFDFEGTLELSWRMPEWEQGKPVGLCVAPDGSVWVADTHYYRVIAYEPNGTERLRFGRFGLGPGEFVYPTDIAIGADGRVYVSEYGGNDRIQVFDQAGSFLFSFGSFGSDPDQFSRPQAIVFTPDSRELLIADSCNHRIVVRDAEGTFLRTFGGVGSGSGELGYPYGIDVLADGSIVVVEFGNSRVQRFSREGESIGIWGGAGFDRGRTRSPWGIAAASGTIFVLDSGNHRVQTMRRP